MATWPTFPGHDGSPEVEIIGGRTVKQEAEGGFVYPVSLRTAPQYRYTFTYAGLRSNVAAPAPYEAMSEIAAALSIVADLDGGAGLIDVVDPISGATVSCRLESDSLAVKRVCKTKWYACTVSFISV